MSVTLSTPTDSITLPDMRNMREVISFQETVLTKRQEVPAPEGTASYRAALIRRKLLHRLVIAAATDVRSLRFERTGRFVLDSIFPGEELQTASVTLIDSWVEVIREQWVILLNWIKAGYTNPLPAIA